MKLLIFCLAALLLTVYVVLSLNIESGYVVIVRETRTIEMRLSAVLITLGIVFTVLYFLLRLLFALWTAPKRTAEWRQRRAISNALSNVQEGYAELVSGHWARAEKKLVTAARGNPAPMMSLLAAAEAANHQGARARRDHYLEQAYQAAPQQLVTVLLARLRMQAQASEYEEAWETLTRLRVQAPKNPLVRLFTVELGRRIGKWKELLQHLPSLHAKGQLQAEQVDAYQLQACHALFYECTDKRELQVAWRELNNAQQHNPQIIAAWTNALLRFDDGGVTEIMLREAIEHRWHAPLVLLYGRIQGDNPTAQYRVAEKWRARHHDDAALLLTLGRLARRNQLWGQARSYLEAAVVTSSTDNVGATYISAQPSASDSDSDSTSDAKGAATRIAPDAHIAQESEYELASLLEELGEQEQALVHYGKARALQSTHTLTLPPP